MKKLLHIGILIFITAFLHAAPGTTYWSIADGDWNDGNTWSTSILGAPAGAVPGAGDNAIIWPGNTVTTTTAITCNTLTVSLLATLDCNAGSAINVTTVSIMLGTLNLNAGTFTGSVANIGGTFNLIGGVFNTTTDFEVVGVHNISGGTFNTDKAFEVNAAGVVNMSGGALNLTGGNNDDLEIDGIFNLSGGSVDVNNDTEVQFGGVLNVSGTGDYTAQGDFKMVFGAGGAVNMTGGSMTFMADFYSNIPANNFIQTAGTITFTGVGSRWTMKAIYQGSGTAHAIFDGDTELYLLASGEWHFYDLTINSGKTLDQHTKVDTITVAHDWTNSSGTYTHNDNAVIFDGIENQNITGTTGTTFYDMVIRNTGAVTTDNIILGQPTTVANTILFTDGIVKSTAINLLTVTNNVTTASNGGNMGSFISGPMAWNLTTGGTYVFPTGKAPNKWARTALSDLTGSTYFTAEYNMTAYTSIDTSDINVPLNNVSGEEYWDISEANAAVDAAVTLYWEDAAFSGITSCTPGGDLVIGHFNGTKWDDQGNSGGITGSCAGSGSAGTIKSGIQTSFSPFTFGSGGSGLNPLPIELLSFTAKQNGSVVALTWETASEINNDFFTVEKTVNGSDFEIVTTAAGAGNSTSILNYTAVDRDPYNRVSYYRLKQTDYDGNISYSDLKMIIFEKDIDFSFVLYPNPNNGETFRMDINTDKSELVLVVVYDILGSAMYAQVLLTALDADNVYAMDPSKKLKPGIYIITATSKQSIYSKRLIVN